MSWFAKNYEKAALGGSVAAALGLAFLGYSKLSGVEQDFGAGLKGQGNNNAAVRDADLIPKTLASLKLDRTWNQALDGDRPVDLFTGIPLFISSLAPEKPIDLLKDAPVHPPIPNVWWIENRLDPGFADSPNRDPDEDGFSNLEEFNAKTDPNSAKSIPSLIAKLMYVKDESLGWVLRPGYGSDGSFPFNYQDTKGAVNKTGAADMITPGGLFFAKGPMMNRFKLLGSEVRKELNKKINIEMDVTIVRIEDQRPNKKGVIYEIPAPLSEERKNEHLKYDRTAIFSLEALGLNGKEFKVEENTKFALPPDSPKKDYLAKIVTPESVTVEYTNPAGETKTFRIGKGGLAAAAE
jgi:hypothetical protein